MTWSGGTMGPMGGRSPQAVALGPPPRQLSPALRAWAVAQFRPRLRVGVLLAVGLPQFIGPGTMLSVYFFGDEPQLWLLWAGYAWLLLAILILGGIPLVSRAMGNAKGRRLAGLLERGAFVTAQVASNQIDYSTELNGSPRRTLDLRIDGRAVRLSTFDNNFANLFPPGGAVEVLFDPAAPDFVYPSSQLPGQ